MANGRCAGCGESGTVKRVQSHIMGCTRYAVLYAQNPDVLGPAEEYDRWQAEGKQEARAKRRVQAIDLNEQRRAQQDARFARLPDILEDP